MSPTYPVPSQRARQVVGEDDAEPEQRLWAAVVAAAARDGLLESWADGDDQEADQMPGAGELRRCGCGGRCFEVVARWAGVSPEVVRELARG